MQEGGEKTIMINNIGLVHFIIGVGGGGGAM